MIILKPISTSQTIKFVQTRDGVANKIVLVNETTNESQEINITIVNGAYTKLFSTIFNLIEGHFYAISIYQNTKLLHRDKVFCTAQQIDAYSVNNNTYTPTQDNIIFYE